MGLVGPLVVGINRFVLSAPAPDLTRIANEDLVGVTVVLISCFYQSKEFLKIGYYVANEFIGEFDPENPPQSIEIDQLRRNIAADQPRVTRIPIDWYAGHDENVPYSEADPNIAEDEPIAVDDGEDIDMEDDEEDDIENMETGDYDVVMSGGEDSMDVANMQNQIIHSESN